MVNRSPLPYVGGKTRMASDIVEVFPEHQTYVEAFGGSAAVLLEKSRSNIEVYNDLYDDVVNYFRVLRDDHEALMDYLKKMPYSRSEFEDIKRRWYDEDDKPENSVVRAAEYFYLQTAGVNSIHRKTGFGASTRNNEARQFHSIVSVLNEFSERFWGVTIEHLDWKDVVGKYDSEETLFYFDPPYYEADTSYYGAGEDFDHEEFVTSLSDLKGYWACSYGKIPPYFGDDVWITAFDMPYHASGTEDEELMDATENLITNYDPEEHRHANINSAGEGDW